eukprot:gene9460-12745_t
MTDTRSVNSFASSAKDSRAEIRDYIRNERDTVLRKWMALKETVKNEDYCRENFYQKRLKADARTLPVNIQKFIGSCKKAVRKQMRNVGGTPFSIIRSLFLYWDADKSGEMSAEELINCMKSLQVKISMEQCEEIVAFYDSGKGTKEMNYYELLQDIQRGEPTVIEFVNQKEEEEKDNSVLRFEEIDDTYKKKQPIVQRFIEAVQSYVAAQLRNKGGTPYQHVRYLFQFYDYDYSDGLDVNEIQLACQRRMNLSITKEQAEQIVAFYDRKHKGEINPELFCADVCEGVQPMLSFKELTPRGIAAAKKKLAANPFIPKRFQAPPNKILEKFKDDVRKALVSKVKAEGGTFSSWIKEAFVKWDPGFTRKISDWKALQGAAQRLGVTINEEEAATLMKCYDRFNKHEMHYMFLAQEITNEDFHFLQDTNHDFSKTATTRTPAIVTTILSKIKSAIDSFVKKSKNVLSGREILHGTCIRFDPTKCGRLDLTGFRQVIAVLKVKQIDLSQVDDLTGGINNDLLAVMKWFDTNGSNLLDYNAMTRQLYGVDEVITEKLDLPTLHENKPLKNSMSLSSIQNATHPKKKLGTNLLLNLNEKNELGLTVLPTEYRVMSTDFIENPSLSFGVDSMIKQKNLENIESPATKAAKMKIKKNKILLEKMKIEHKLSIIEESRQKIINEYKEKKKLKKLQTINTTPSPELTNSFQLPLQSHIQHVAPLNFSQLHHK